MKKLLIYGDHYKNNSAYARNIRDLLPYLTKEYDVRQVSLGWNGLPPSKDIICYPTKLPDIKDYWSPSILHYALEDFKPDIVLTIQDFYITKNNSRLYIKENLNVLFDCLKKGDKIAYNEDGIALVTGFSDNFKRHYIKFLTKDAKTAEDLLQLVSWNLEIDFYCKIKKNNTIVNILRENGFKFVGSRGQEILLKREHRELIKEK